MSKTSRVINNAFALYLLQAANYVIPLVTLPYLIRTLNLENFGRIAYAMALAQALNTIIAFSFNHTATQKIARANGNKELISTIYTQVLVAKTFFLFIALLFLALLTFLVPSLQKDAALIWTMSLILIGEVIFPIWLFLGIEKMFLIAFFSIISRLISLAALLLFVNDPGDTVLAGAIQASPYLLSGLLSLPVIYVLGFRLRPIGRTNVDLNLFKNSIKAFLGALPSQVYARGSILVLGVYASAVEIGSFAMAQRIFSLIPQLVSPIAQATYPHISRTIDLDPVATNNLRRLLITSIAAWLIVCSVVLFLSADWLMSLIAGAEQPRAALILRAASAVMVLSGLNVLLNVFVVASQKYRDMAKMYTMAALIFLLLSFPLASVYGGIGIAITITLVELSVFLRSLSLARRARTINVT